MTSSAREKFTFANRTSATLCADCFDQVSFPKQSGKNLESRRVTWAPRPVAENHVLGGTWALESLPKANSGSPSSGSEAPAENGHKPVWKVLIIVIMTNTLPSSVSPNAEAASASFAEILLEPLLMAGSALFWVLVLPLAGIFRVSVGIYDFGVATVAKIRPLQSLGNCQANPLVLRKGAAHPAKPAIQSAVAGQSA